MSREKGPKYLTGDETGGYSQRQKHKRAEKRTQKRTGGVQTIGSGNQVMKGDNWFGDREVGQHVMVEDKSTSKKSIRVKRQWLEKLRHDAAVAGMEPMLVLHFMGERHDEYEWAAVPFDRLVQLFEAEAELKRLKS